MGLGLRGALINHRAWCVCRTLKNAKSTRDSSFDAHRTKHTANTDCLFILLSYALLPKLHNYRWKYSKAYAYHSSCRLSFAVFDCLLLLSTLILLFIILIGAYFRLIAQIGQHFIIITVRNGCAKRLCRWTCTRCENE